MSQSDLQQTAPVQREGDTVAAPVGEPLPEEIAALTRMERVAFRVTQRMNEGRWKDFWTFCQRTLGAGWIRISTYNLIQIYGLENFDRVSHERPILLVSNHRSFFDMYTVSAILFQRTSWPKKLFFPVRARFFYESPLGMFVNLVMGWWSMYPPFFAAGSNPILDKREFDKFSMRLLTDLCRRGPAHIIGFHPEGTRNQNPDPYSFLPAKPGVGKLIKDAQPQVVPVFVAGLSNDLLKQVVGNWTGGQPIRLHFGAPLDYTEFLDRRDGVRAYKEIAEFVMSKIAQLGEQDRALYGEGMRDEG